MFSTMLSPLFVAFGLKQHESGNGDPEHRPADVRAVRQLDSLGINAESDTIIRRITVRRRRGVIDRRWRWRTGVDAVRVRATIRPRGKKVIAEAPDIKLEVQH
ncbi:MAG: hypothetical protein WCD76_05775 [Pyrinomonadaceae bacterium]